jgi:hypothetical protein
MAATASMPSFFELSRFELACFDPAWPSTANSVGCWSMVGASIAEQRDVVTFIRPCFELFLNIFDTFSTIPHAKN